MHQGMQGVKLHENAWVLLLQGLWKHAFMGKKRERTEENYITTFLTLENLGLFAKVK